MRIRPLAAGATLLLLLLALPAGASADRRSERAAADREAGAYVVVFRDRVGSVTTETRERERRDGFRSEFRYRHALKGFAADLSPNQVRRLRADPEVDSVEPVRTYRARATAPLADGDGVPTGIRRIRAATPDPDGAANVASSVNVAVVDTGIDLGHPDLNAVDGTDCSAPGTPAQDDNGHGTHVAGSVAAQNDGAGVVGVAPDTRLYAVKVLDAGGSGTDPQIICGIDWVTSTRTDADPGNDIAVANMSLGGLGNSTDNNACGSSTALHEAICNSTARGVTYAVAAGNDAWEFPHATLPDVPASYDEVVTVTAASDSDGLPGAAGGAPTCRTGEADDRYASFSNWSDNATDNAHTIAAPGVCIRSTWPQALSPAGGYHTISGTSMASPHVAGTLARCFGERTDGGGSAAGPCAGVATDGSGRIPPRELIARIRHTDPAYGFAGDPNQPVSGRYYGYLALAGSPPPVEPSFTLSASPPSREIRRGGSTTYSITITPSGGFSSPVSLSVSGLRSGWTASFSPNPATTSSTMTVRASSSAERARATLTISGAGGGVTKTATVTLRVK